MKLSAGKRVIMLFHWLFSLLICAAFAIYILKPEWTMNLYGRVFGGMSDTRVMVIGIAILAIYVILTVVQACIIFHRTRRADRGFITVDSSDAGKVRIAVSAIEQMVRQSVISIDGISEMRIAIENNEESIGINIAAILQNGCHVPTVTMNMQRAIRQFVEMNCGVAVRAVSISINAVANPGEGGRRRGKRRDSVAPAPVFTPAVAAPEAPAESATPVIEPEYGAEYPVNAETASEDEAPVFIPDPEPITLHFDHLPAQDDPQPEDAETPLTEGGTSESADDEL